MEKHKKYRDNIMQPAEYKKMKDSKRKKGKKKKK